MIFRLTTTCERYSFGRNFRLIPDSDGEYGDLRQISHVVHFSDVAGGAEDKCGELIRGALDQFYSLLVEPLLLPQTVLSLHNVIAVSFIG